MSRRSRGPLCPACAKPFRNEKTLLQHLNQPRGRCAVLAHDIETLALPRGSATFSAPNDDSDDPTFDEDGPTFDEETFYDTDMAGSTDDGAQAPNARHREFFPGAGKTYGKGPTFMAQFDADKHANWELGSWLLRSGLSMRLIDDFLRLQKIKELSMSYHNAKELRNRAEMLPEGPQWKCKPWKVTTHPTKRPINLFYRDSIDCIRALFRNPLFSDAMHYTPFREFKTAERIVRVYEEWMSANAAWNIQDKLPEGATLLGTILSSDKTNISVMTGDRVAHPLLISLANIAAEVRMKSSQHAFILLALLPVPKFLEKRPKVRGILNDRLTHACLDFVLAPLKMAAAIGIMMTDPLGQSRFCFTPCAAYMVDTQEALMLAGVAGKTSHLTTADYRHFGDAFRHDTRTAALTLSQRDAIRRAVDHSADLAAYGREAMKYRLNGVDQLFFRDWPHTEPSRVLTPEPLHHWHKAFWDHDAKWCIRAVGPSEIDFRFSILPPRVGFRQFKEGIAKLKQVTGREHRDVERYMVGIIADAVPKDFLITIRSMMEFRYLSQAPVVSADNIASIKGALDEFHQHKQAILDADARVGKGNRPINNWYIPKIEMLQSVPESIEESGAANQWSADITEHGHVTEIKDPARHGNNQDYGAQICRALDRTDKLRKFELATSMRAAGVDFAEQEDPPGPPDLDSDKDADGDDLNGLETHRINRTSVLLRTIRPTATIAGPRRQHKDYFAHAALLAADNRPGLPFPPRTFISAQTAFHLARDPPSRLTVDNTSALYNLPDLRPALKDYLQHVTNPNTNIATLPIGGRRIALPDCTLPFNDIRIWKNVRIQTKKYHHPDDAAEAHTVMASPPSADWPAGHYDTVLVNTDTDHVRPKSGIQGHCVSQIRLIFQIPGAAIPGGGNFLVYVQRFDIVPQANHAPNSQNARSMLQPEPATKMYVLKRALRADKSRLGDIIPLSRLRTPIYLQPRFGPVADPRLTAQTSLEFSSECWLNHYAEKEHFWAMHTL
ncbi:hypothetical protein HWV62_21918 [Athelia sp. TMB]|nr:hypothetical protein HWV62_21918 [Athelia sp. TMB]